MHVITNIQHLHTLVTATSNQQLILQWFLNKEYPFNNRLLLHNKLKSNLQSMEHHRCQTSSKHLHNHSESKQRLCSSNLLPQRSPLLIYL